MKIFILYDKLKENAVTESAVSDSTTEKTTKITYLSKKARTFHRESPGKFILEFSRVLHTRTVLPHPQRPLHRCAAAGWSPVRTE